MADVYKKCRLNNMKMQAVRKEFTYQAVIIDLALAGLITKASAENVLGYTIPSTIQLPAWCTLSASTSSSKKASAKVTITDSDE